MSILFMMYKLCNLCFFYELYNFICSIIYLDGFFISIKCCVSFKIKRL
jgi:hypothetical protein